jgi:hypothetical protein
MRWILFIFLMSSLQALEIDEKLTARFLKVSESRKTVLLNRGLEDGLVAGDHAKFFITTGVIARGTVVKASPTRTIWSLYRIVDGTKVFTNKVVNIKISKPVKITEDASKALRPDFVPQGVEVVQAEGNIVNETEMDDLSKNERVDLKDFKEGTMMDYDMERSFLDYRSLEIFGLLHFSSLSSTVDQNASGSYTSGDSNINATLGFEKYFTESTGFFRSVSFSAFIHRDVAKVTSIANTSITIGVFEYGGAFNFHFNENPRTHQMVYFGQIGAGVGSVEDTTEGISSSSSSTNTIEGSNTFFQIGLGAKYYLNNGIGFRGVIDYYVRSEKYKFDDTGDEYTKKVSGPRALLGLSFRF